MKNLVEICHFYDKTFLKIILKQSVFQVGMIIFFSDHVYMAFPSPMQGDRYAPTNKQGVGESVFEMSFQISGH